MQTRNLVRLPFFKGNICWAHAMCQALWQGGAEDTMLSQMRIFQAGRGNERENVSDPGRGKSMCKGQEIKEHKLFQVLKVI